MVRGHENLNLAVISCLLLNTLNLQARADDQPIHIKSGDCTYQVADEEMAGNIEAKRISITQGGNLVYFFVRKSDLPLKDGLNATYRSTWDDRQMTVSYNQGVPQLRV